MKKFILLLLSVLLFTSCECYYCDEPYDDYLEYRNTGQDCFYADRLIGTWQCCYPMYVGNMEYKQIRFMRNGHADITMARDRDTDWFTYTYTYTYYGNTIRFSRNGQTISFTIWSFLSPELTVYDSFGKYVWRYVRTE